MSKNDWLKALYNETRNNAIFAYYWAMTAYGYDKTYKKADTIQYASPELQKAYSARTKTCKANQNRNMRDNVMRSMGLTKCIGSVSGKVYWE